MIIGGQIPGRTIEQNLTSEARDGFAMSLEECLSSKTSRAKRVTVLRWSRRLGRQMAKPGPQKYTESNKMISMDQKKNISK
ncbi:hypothetical protein DERF_004005 [Dermatophagoides farinae]|uniref:Uncharacterized protein n=1 Tax=Dermatophagoides farinae TaxID=6954 RepID=A0A922IF85_DERFA|nr:hypothetical protein DERF_004005 [Dermatophagoides farinae]